jgi:hypothetical protein
MGFRVHRGRLVCLPVSRGEGVTGRFRRLAERLMNQQCWCWGCDIRSPGGNVLQLYGMQQRRPPAGVRGSTCYTATLPNGRVVGLWGFGACIGNDAGCVYINRYRYRPVHVPIPASEATRLHSPVDLDASGARLRNTDAACFNLLAELFEAFAAYETWVRLHVGLHHRERAVRAWSERPAVDAGDMSETWRLLARLVHRPSGLTLSFLESELDRLAGSRCPPSSTIHRWPGSIKRVVGSRDARP